MHVVIKKKPTPYLKEKALKDVNHLFGTQVNEVINWMIT